VVKYLSSGRTASFGLQIQEALAGKEVISLHRHPRIVQKDQRLPTKLIDNSSLESYVHDCSYSMQANTFAVHNFCST
jgi:hypothetical protein